MDIYQEIQTKIRELRDSGMTQAEISKVTGISQPFISQLLNPKDGAKRVAHLQLEKFFKLFPNARIVFDDRRSMGDVTNNSGQVVNGDITAPLPPLPQQQGARAADEFLARIMASDEIDAETKVKIFNLYTPRG